MTRGPSGSVSSPRARLGGAFLRAAKGPIDYAASCVLGNRIQVGLEELAPDGLQAAFMRGLSDVATLAGVPLADVERAAPLAQIRALAERLRASHPRAVSAWKLHAGNTGFLDVVTALTVDGRVPDIALCLDRVAGKVRHDKALSQPLAELSRDLAAWTDLVARTEESLAELSWLGAALRRRGIKRAVFAILVMGTLSSITSAIVYVRLQRDAVEARVAAARGCAAEALGEADLKWANDEQRARLAQERGVCDAERAREAEERRAVEERERRKQAEEEALRARARACDDLAADVEGGELDAATKATAGDSASLLERVAKKTLEPSDVGPADPVFPCADSQAARGRLEKAYAQALMVDPMLWARRSDPSPFAQKIAVARKAEVAKNVLIGLADNAERTAKSGLSGGDKATLARAKRLCAFTAEMGMPGPVACPAIASL